MAAGLAFALSSGSAEAKIITAFQQTNLVSTATDPDLVNAWGISYNPTGPFWVSDNGTGVSTLYNGSGTKLGLTVEVYPGRNQSAPTGQVFNSTASDFMVSKTTGGVTSTGKAAFIFATEDGTLSGWSPGVDGTHSLLGVDNSASGAIYKGLAIGNNGTQNVLYAANFGARTVDMINGTWGSAGSFTDTSLPSNYAPFNVQTLNGKLYVSFAQTTGGLDEVDAPGLGYVDEFNLDGTLSRRIASAGGPLDAPWGMAIAPSTFGTYAGDLLVGNFGNGTVDAYNLTTLHYDGKLLNTSGIPLSIDGLWALIPGNGGLAGSTGNIYFSAGPEGESLGLFGSLSATSIAVPEPATWTTMILGLGALGALLRRRYRLQRA
jgi:uncharacterized protein (TIGR03118 family)